MQNLRSFCNGICKKSSWNGRGARVVGPFRRGPSQKPIVVGTRARNGNRFGRVQHERNPGKWEMSQVSEAIRAPGGSVSAKSVGSVGDKADGVSVLAPLAGGMLGVLEDGGTRAGGKRRGPGRAGQECLRYRVLQVTIREVKI